MATTITIELAAFADAMKKAGKCAPPNKPGHEYDVAAGVMISIRPTENPAMTVRSTNLEVFYCEWLNVTEVEGDPVDWRVPTRLADLVMSFPLASGRVVTMDDLTGVLRVRCQRMTGTLRLMDRAGYRLWEPFHEEVTEPVTSFGDRISQVSWALDSIEQPLTGILMTGTHLVASKRNSAARVPCPIPALNGQKLVVPAKLLGQVIRASGDVRVGILEKQIAVVPDQGTQIRCATFGDQYPDVDRALKTDYGEILEVSKEELVTAVQRLDNVTKSKTSSLGVMIGGGQILLVMLGEEKEERFEDALTLSVGGQHPPVLMNFIPSVFMDGISKIPGDRATLHYDVGGARHTPVYATGPGGYEAWFMQRAV